VSSAGVGNDEITLVPDSTNDAVAGGGGTDTVVAKDNPIILTDTSIEGATEIDALSGIEKGSLAAVSDGMVNASAFTGTTTITGDSGDETLIAGRGRDQVIGQDGNDTIKGGNANDKLLGKDGNDTLVGGKGNDTCKGGPGNNTIKSCE